MKTIWLTRHSISASRAEREKAFGTKVKQLMLIARLCVGVCSKYFSRWDLMMEAAKKTWKEHLWKAHFIYKSNGGKIAF